MSLKVLPNAEHSFVLDVEGEETKQRYEGTFTFKVPTLGVKSEIAKTVARLNAGLPVDEDTRLLHQMMAFLKHTLIKSPEWWEKSTFGYDLTDATPLIELYKECLGFESKRRDAIFFGDAETPKEEPKEALTKKVK